MKNRKEKRELLLVAAGLLAAAVCVHLIYTDTPRPDGAALAAKAPEAYTMGELEYLLLACVNEGELLPYRVGTRRFLRLAQNYMQDMTAWDKPPGSHIAASPLREAFRSYLGLYCALSNSTVGGMPKKFWQSMRFYTRAQLRAMNESGTLLEPLGLG